MGVNQPVPGELFVRRYLLNRDVLVTYLALVLFLHFVGLYLLPFWGRLYVTTAAATLGCEQGVRCGFLGWGSLLVIAYPPSLLIAPKVRELRR